LHRLYANFCYDNCVCYSGAGFSYQGNKENNPRTAAPPNGFASWDAYYNSALLAAEARCEHKPCSGHQACSNDACFCDSTRTVGANAWLFKASCAGITSLGKRDDTTAVRNSACPCNCTYVSEPCCHSSSGIVWPDPKFPQLGALAPPDKTSCCNTATGEFQPGPVGVNGTNCL